jgi:hypothetical protein
MWLSQERSLRRLTRRVADEAVDLFEVADLSPTLTGLPMVVWTSERGRVRQENGSRHLFPVLASAVRSPLVGDRPGA